jgi:diketogulonate reductase-like aldo/keto reductase
MRSVELPSGARMPVFGMGTWRMGENPRRRTAEADVLRHGLDLGCTMIDTAEMYGDGGAELAVGDAIAGRRDGLYIVSKVYPHNASRRGTIEACERSLKRMRIDRIDLYLLHWRGSVPLAETAEAFQHLRQDGKIADFGVSNFDLEDMQGWSAHDRGLTGCNQVMFNLARRGIEFDLLPWLGKRKIPVMAYSPLDQASLLDHPALRKVAARVGATPAQVALAWLLQIDGVVVIPKSSDRARTSENFGALNVTLTAQDQTELDRAFPAPKRKQPLAMS